MLSLSATLLLSSVFQTANAQSTPAAAPPTAAKKELIARLLKLQRPGIEAMSRDMAQEPALQMLERAAAVVQARVPQDKQEAVIKGLQVDAKKYMDTTIPVVRDRAVALAPDALGPLLDQRFNDDELKKVIAILESPEYAKFQQLGGEMQQALQTKLIAETQNSVSDKLKTLESDVTRRLNAVVAQGPAAAPAAGASTSPAAKAATKPAATK
ncbi:MAG: hypothetical protein WEK74_09360 [Hydrogenophaga sp.]